MPAPLLIPPTVTVLPPISNCTAACLDTVSVVMMASAASAAAAAVSALAAASFSTPARIRSMGS